MKYLVTVIYDASKSVEVEADDVDGAVDAAAELAHASLCHYCSHKVELGDAYRWIVTDENGNEETVG